MSFKKIATLLGTALTALFLCPTARADQNFVDFDDYLIAAPIMTAGSMTKGNGTNYYAQNPATFVSVVSTPTVYYRADGSSYISVETVVSSDTIAAQTFTDGQAATATLTVASYLGLSTAAATGNLTAVSTSAAAGVVGTANIVVITNTTGTIVQLTGPPGNPVYTLGGNLSALGSTTNIATAFATQVNVSSWTVGVSATSSANVVTLSCINVGTFCSAYAVTSTTPTAISTAAFNNAANPVSVTVGPATFVAGNQFAVGTSTQAMAANLAAAITADLPGVIVATAATSCAPTCGIVYSTAVVAGTVGNGYALATSNWAAISTGSVALFGGQNNAVITINGVALTANQSFYPVTSTAQTATNLALAISNNFATIGATATAGGSVVYATATVDGTSANSFGITVTTNAITPSVLVSSVGSTGAQVGIFSGGANPAYTLVNGTGTVITIPAHGFNTALPVLYSTGSATALTGLTNQTTYYPIFLTANTISLASSTYQAMLGNALPLTSSTTKATGDSFTLTPLAITGTPSWQFVVSDDAINWATFGTTSNNISISSRTYTSYISTGSVDTYDLGHMDYVWFGAKVIPPTTGALNFGMKVIGKTQ